MNYRPGSVVRLALSARVRTQRFAFLLSSVAAVGLILLGRAETVLVERVRAEVTDFVAPIMGLVSRPVAALTGVMADISELGRLHAENARLRRQNERLMHWQAAARRLSGENDRFRDLLRFVPEPNVHSTAARVVADSGGVFVRSVVVTVGARVGIAEGQAVVAGAGLAGRVQAVGSRSARVLLLTDLNSRVPVVLEDSRERAILAGDNSARPHIQYLPGAAVHVGERVVTSGHGGVLPPGLPIGTVSGVDGDGVRVRLFVDPGGLEFVQILHHPEVAMPQVVRPAVLPRGVGR